MGSSQRFVWGCLVAWLALAPCPTLWAQSASTLQLLDATLPQTLLVDIDRAGNLVFQSPTEQKVVPGDEIVWWRRPGTLTTQASVGLADGSWLSGRIAWSSNQRLQLSSDWFDVLELDLNQLRAIIFQPSPGVRQNIELQSQMLGHVGSTDKVWKKRGEPATGVVQSQAVPPKPGSSARRVAWSLKPDKSETQVALNDDDLVGIAFSPILRAGLPENDSRLQMTLTDSSRLKVTRLKRLDDGRVELALDANLKLTTIDSSMEFALSITELSGHSNQATWLSDQEPARYRLLNSASRVAWPLGQNRDLFGKPLYANQLPIDKALVIHAPAQVAYRWDGRPARFLTTLSLLSEATSGALPPKPGSVKFQVLVGKSNQLTSVYQSPLVQSDQPPIDVAIDVSGAQLIVLLVEPAEDGPLGDHLLLRDPRLK